MKYIEAPEVYTGQAKSIFLAGGITNCPDWQSEMRNLLADTNVVLVNPRRKDFPIDDPSVAKKQIQWEHSHLRKAYAILFWFPKETLCPIVLYELGSWSMMNKPLFIGIHPEYKRKQDVEIQTSLVRPGFKIVYDLTSLSQQVREFSMGFLYKLTSRKGK